LHFACNESNSLSFYSCVCYNTSIKEDERSAETDIESKQQHHHHHQLASIHKIGQQQQYQQPQYSISSSNDLGQHPQPEAAAAMR
jgi:hypothetical protein